MTGLTGSGDWFSKEPLRTGLQTLAAEEEESLNAGVAGIAIILRCAIDAGVVTEFAGIVICHSKVVLWTLQPALSLEVEATFFTAGARQFCVVA